ncbi:hypothetical protein ATCC90586_002941 [Pythium insidiosum]|nr:hypothetical protein ATCC90586_002941 [Pythium insidiosum]
MPLRKFELLSLVGRKKPEEEHAAHASSSSSSSSGSSYSHPSTQSFHHSASHRSASAHASSSAAFHQSNFRSLATPSVTSGVPPPPPTVSIRDHTYPQQDGFYPSVQYERLTPSSAVSSSSVSYERLTPSTAEPRYERLSPSTVLASPGSSTISRTSPSISFRQNSPLYDHSMPTPTSLPSPIPPLSGVVQSSRSASFPTSSGGHSPAVALPPVDIAPLRADVRRSKPPRPTPSLNTPGTSLPTVVENGSPDVVMEPSSSTPMATGSDKSTPFSIVMEEWMSQLRTPTPDVTLLPSPFDFNRGTPTPVEKVEDIRQIHDALLPTPPPDCHDQNQGTKNQDYVLSAANRRPLVEDIASLCRDLISQEVAEQLAKRLHAVLPEKTGVATVRAAVTAPPKSRVAPVVPVNGYASSADNGSPYDEENDRNDDTGSVNGGRGKRRKMCTAEGCQNLSRSHGCTKSSQGDGYCRTHGGGRRCGHPSGCTKWAQRNGMCMAHSEGRYGNSYRGRLARMQEEEDRSAAVTLISAASAPVS